VEYARFLATRLKTIPPSGIRRFFDIIATMPDVISLGIGEPDFVTPQEIVEAGVRSLRDGHTGYTSNSGLFELREAVSAYLAERYDVHYDPEREVLITVGVSEALHLAATALLDPGDEVIIPEPCFVSYGATVALAGAKPVYVPTRVQEGFQVNADAVADAMTARTKAILVGYPNNPTGAVMGRERLQELVALAGAHDVLIWSDEIYDRLVYGVEHICVPSLPGARERTLLLGGFSKDFAMTGWRLGYVCGPAPLIAGLRKVHQYIIMSAPTTAQYAALEALKVADQVVEHMRLAYDRRRHVIVRGLNDIGLPTFEPQGAFYAFPNIESTGLTDEEFAERLLMEERVAVIPGSVFGPSGAGFVRCSYATSLTELEEALDRIERFVRRVGREGRRG